MCASNGLVSLVSKIPVASRADDSDHARPGLSRRNLLLALGTSALAAGCTRTFDIPTFDLDDMSTGSVRPQISIDRTVTRPELMYASLTDEGFQVPEVPFKKIDPKWRRQVVVDPTGEAPGTIVVRLQERFLYLVQPGGDAIVGVAGGEWPLL